MNMHDVVEVLERHNVSDVKMIRLVASQLEVMAEDDESLIEVFCEVNELAWKAAEQHEVNKVIADMRASGCSEELIRKSIPCWFLGDNHER